jgi:hypothetical protein
VRDKSKLPCVRCVTDHCSGYITFLGSFEGPVGHETFRIMHFTASAVSSRPLMLQQAGALVRLHCMAVASNLSLSFTSPVKQVE